MLHAFAIYCVDPFGNYFLSYLTHIRLRSAFKLQVRWKYQIMNDKKMDLSLTKLILMETKEVALHCPHLVQPY